jgi:phytoene dehydrogenase-like protein
MTHPDVVIVGAGLAGLACARELLRRGGRSVLLLEGCDAPGGRTRTDRQDGFLLDRGFQVLQTAYPEARRVLNYKALDLRRFYPGALIRFAGRFHRLADPWRRPVDALGSFSSPISTLADKIRLARFRQRVVTSSFEEIYRRPETTAIRALRQNGFSERFIERFLRPFLAGVFFDNELQVSSRAFEFVFWAFAAGDVAVPAHGMGAITQQLAARLLPRTLRTGARVRAVREGGVLLESGEWIPGRAVVIATDGPETARLLDEREQPGARGTTCLYWAAPRAPIGEPILVLNGDGRGPINSLAVPSLSSSAYAPPGRALVMVNVLGVPDSDDDVLEGRVRAQLREWFGAQVRGWSILRILRLPRALPLQLPPVEYPAKRPVQVCPWLFVCGDYQNAASIQWSLVSGRRAAEAVSATVRSA